jgi:hypothetical protein
MTNIIIWSINTILGNIGFQSRINPIFVSCEPRILVTQIEYHKNIVQNSEQLVDDLKRTGMFNAFTYLKNMYQDRNYNYSLIPDGHSDNGTVKYLLLLNNKNKYLDLSPINKDQLHDNFKNLPEADGILFTFNKYLRYIKWQIYGTNDGNEFHESGIWKVIHEAYPLSYNDKEIYINIS